MSSVEHVKRGDVPGQVASAFLLMLLGCDGRSKVEEGTVAPAKPAADAAASTSTEEHPSVIPAAERAASPARSFSPPVAGLEIVVPAGTVRLGSPTGHPNRDPAREADDIAVALRAFAIDALPYPNDPAQAPRALVDRAQAEALCGERGQRLCTELEWERACKGDEGAEHAWGTHAAPERCASAPQACASVLGVYAMGLAGREWTRSDATPFLGDALRTAVVRGAAPDAPARSHRCAARDAATPDSRAESLVFRCCRGPVTEEPYPSEPALPAFAPAKLDDVRRAVAAMAETRALAEGFRPFEPGDITESLQRAGQSRARMSPWLPMDGALAWSPVHGEQVVVATFDSKLGAALVAYYPLADGNVRLAASYVAKGEHAPIVLAHRPDQRSELLFSSCWGCGGEGAALTLGDDGRLHVSLR